MKLREVKRVVQGHPAGIEILVSSHTWLPRLGKSGSPMLPVPRVLTPALGEQGRRRSQVKVSKKTFRALPPERMCRARLSRAFVAGALMAVTQCKGRVQQSEHWGGQRLKRRRQILFFRFGVEIPNPDYVGQ